MVIAGTYNWFGPITLTPDPYAHWGIKDATPVAASGKRRQLLTTGGADVAAAAGAATADPQPPGVCDDGTGGYGVGAGDHQCSSSSSSSPDMVQQHNPAEILFTPLRRLQQSSGSSSMSAPVTGRVTLNETGVGTPSSAQDAARKDGQTWLDDMGEVQIIGPVSGCWVCWESLFKAWGCHETTAISTMKHVIAANTSTLLSCCGWSICDGASGHRCTCVSMRQQQRHLLFHHIM
jgi:hypothetical protein